MQLPLMRKRAGQNAVLLHDPVMRVTQLTTRCNQFPTKLIELRNLRPSEILSILALANTVEQFGYLA